MNDQEHTTSTGDNEFARHGEMKPASMFDEYVYFLKHNKKWWLLPLLLVLVATGLLVALGSTAAAPFIYTLF